MIKDWQVTSEASEICAMCGCKAVDGMRKLCCVCGHYNY
jgi:hypothetical protein